MQKKTKIIIGAAALFIAVAVGLQVFIHTEKQKDIAKLNAAISTDSIHSGNTDAGDKLGVDTGDGTAQSGTTGTAGTAGTTGGTSSEGSTAAPTPSASPTVTPAPSASPAPAATKKPEATPATPAATPKPTQKPASNTPQDGDTRNSGGQAEIYIEGFGWLADVGTGGTCDGVAPAPGGNLVGQ